MRAKCGSDYLLQIVSETLTVHQTIASARKGGSAVRILVSVFSTRCSALPGSVLCALSPWFEQKH